MKRKIYNVASGVIEVYDFEPISYKLALFRLEEMKGIPQKKQILRKDNPRSWFTRDKGIVYECDNYTLREFDYTKMDQVDLVNMIRKFYINGSFKNDPVLIRDDLILLSPDRGLTDYRIQLTEDAYMEYLIENEQFDSPELEGKSLDKQRGLFRISDEPIVTVSIDEFKKMHQAQLVSGNFHDTMDSLERTSKVLSKIREK